ncbi:MAG: coproporphyrinogen dehydrogenase HemZ [Lachnospiraceae bacterium]|nr:coproporphyrinogen dehydrogenase HemZ [Lachnospiraceae bacterium]
MLAVWIDKANFEYDVHSIVKAFYPEETVKVLTPETGEQKMEEYKGDVKLQILLSDDGAQMVVQGDADAAENYSWSWDRQCGDTYKDCFKRFLYESLSHITGKTLPWGNLTGIRPTKIAYGMLEEGKSEDEILTYLEKKHFVSDEKSNLSIDIAKRERELLSGVHYEGGYSLYIGIPFCPTTCLYCSFTSFAIGAYRKQVDDYVDCLIKEMEYVSKRYADKILDSVYIGGGTPTTLEAHQLDRLIGKVKELFDFSQVKEFTVEAGRPDSVTEEKLQVLYRHGATRISINPQTMKQETLDLIGRRHTVEQVVEAYQIARKIGFDNINMDLILGLPGETPEDVQRTIDRVVELAPDSLTVHSLAIKRASRLSQWIQENGISALQNTDETMAIAAAGAKRLGMEPYYLYRQKNMSGNFENVGYAHPGKFGLYNILIMEEKQTIVALGAGSITKLVLPGGRIERTDNVKDVKLYIEKIDEMIERKEQLFSLEE